jgi:hypothetical protein
MKMKKTVELFGYFMKTVFIAPITLSKIASKIYSTSTEKPRSTGPYLMIFGGLFLSSILFFSLQVILDGSWAIGLFLYLCFCGCTARLRMNVRKSLRISGHAVEDFFCSVILYPSVIMQLEMTLNPCKPLNGESP